MRVYAVKKRKPRIAPALGKGVRVVITEPGWARKPFSNVGEIIAAGHPGFWFVGVDHLFLKFSAEHLDPVPYDRLAAS